jgi:hypothetical protein
MSTKEADKVRIQVGNEVWETDIWGLPLMAEAILRSTDDEVKLDVDERDLLEASDNAAV